MEKQSNSRAVWVIVAVAIVLAVGATVYALSASNNTSDDSKEVTTSDSDTNSDGAVSPEPAAAATGEGVQTGSTVIVFTDNGFNPKNYTSKVGEAVTVRNDSKMDLQFSSDDHPTHRDHPELNMKVLSSGESSTFTPPGKGTYGFHDHINDDFTGMITVK